jgi:hypothetical protein
MGLVGEEKEVGKCAVDYGDNPQLAPRQFGQPKHSVGTILPAKI